MCPYVSSSIGCEAQRMDEDARFVSASHGPAPQSFSNLTALGFGGELDEMDGSSLTGELALGRIVNGQASWTHQGVELTRESFPYFAALSTSTGIMYCGAGVISTRYAVTAAHCVSSYLSKIYLGKKRHSNRCEVAGCRAFTVASYFVHPDYSGSRTLRNDIAIIHTVEDMPVGAIGDVISQGDASRALTYVIAGFGALGEDDPSPDVMQIATVPRVSMELCRDTPIGH